MAHAMILVKSWEPVRDVRTVNFISTFLEDLLAKEDCACGGIHKKIIIWHILPITNMFSSIVS